MAVNTKIQIKEFIEILAVYAPETAERIEAGIEADGLTTELEEQLVEALWEHDEYAGDALAELLKDEAVAGHFGPGFVFNPAVFGDGGPRSAR